MKKKVALITGITGQDGAYLADFLLKKGYEVHGLRRRTSSSNLERLKSLFDKSQGLGPNFYLHYCDLTDSSNTLRTLNEVQPDEVYNLAAMSDVHVSFLSPEHSTDVDALGALRLLEACRILKLEKTVKIYQASTSELYGKVLESPQNESTPFHPRSPYGVAKLYAYWISINYRESYDMHVSNGILFNHESPLRGESFVTRKITTGISRMIFGEQEKLYLGNLSAIRDWGHAKDYVEAMWLMLQQKKPDDFVISTGKNYSVKEFLIRCFLYIGIELEFIGEGIDEKALVKAVDKKKFAALTKSNQLSMPKIGDIVVEVDPYYFRPSEVDCLIGDSSKAKNILGWEPKLGLNSIVDEMMEFDIKLQEHRIKAPSPLDNFFS